MIGLVKKLLRTQNNVVGINKRNLGYVFPNNPRKHYGLANDKAQCKSILIANHIPTPETYLIIENMWDLKVQMKALNNLDSFVVKPAEGSGGGGILILFKTKQLNCWTTHSGGLVTADQLEYHLASILYGAYSHGGNDKAIIEFCLTPHPFFEQIYKGGIPDFRIIVYKQKALMAMLRVPTERSGGKANLHQGAMGIGVDMDKGVLTNGYYRNQFIEEHPDSLYKFRDVVIPNFNDCIDISIETSKLFPLDYLGVDVIYDKFQGPMVIEINARPGLQIQNVNKEGINQCIKRLKLESDVETIK